MLDSNFMDMRECFITTIYIVQVTFFLMPPTPFIVGLFEVTPIQFFLFTFEHNMHGPTLKPDPNMGARTRLQEGPWGGIARGRWGRWVRGVQGVCPGTPYDTI